MSETPEPVNGKTRKRTAAKAASRSSASKVKATIHLSLEASQRLTVHAAMLGMDRSELVESIDLSALTALRSEANRGGAGGGEGKRE